MGDWKEAVLTKRRRSRRELSFCMLGLVGEGRVGEERGGGEDDDGDTAGLGDFF